MGVDTTSITFIFVGLALSNWHLKRLQVGMYSTSVDPLKLLHVMHAILYTLLCRQCA